MVGIWQNSLTKAVRLWMVVLVLVGTECYAGAQSGVVSLKGRPILNFGKVFTATHDGPRRYSYREVSQIDVMMLVSDLQDVQLSDVRDADSWWIWKGSQDASGVIKPDLNALPLHPIHAAISKNKHILLDLDPDRQGLKNGDHLMLFLSGLRDNASGSERVVVNQRGLNLTVVRREPTDSSTAGGVAYAPKEERENGMTQAAVHAEVLFDAPNVGGLPIGEPRFHVVVDSLLSTLPTDLSANISATVYAERLPAVDGLFKTFRLSPFAGFESSESFQNQAWSTGLQATVRIRGTAFGTGTIFNSVRDACLVFVPIEYQDWFRTSTADDLLYLHPDILLTSAVVRWEPIFLFSHREVPDVETDYSLHLGLGMWRLLTRASEPGPAPSETVARFDIELQIPLEKLGIQRWLPIKARLALDYGAGAVPEDGYLSTASFSVGFKTSF